MDKQVNKLLKAVETYLEINSGDSEQIDGLHKVRVNARKLVSVSPPESYQIKLFKQVIQSSNKLRDLDVFSSEILPAFPQKWQSSMAPLYEGVEEFREKLDIKFKLWLETDLIVDIQDLLTNFEQIVKKSTGRSEKHKVELNEIERRLKKNIKLIQRVDIEDKHIHKIRLKIKQLRYQVEHFYPEEKALLKKCTYLQDELGHFHDLCQGIKLLQKHEDLLEKSQLKKYLKHLEKNKTLLMQKVRTDLHKK